MRKDRFAGQRKPGGPVPLLFGGLFQWYPSVYAVSGPKGREICGFRAEGLEKYVIFWAEGGEICAFLLKGREAGLHNTTRMKFGQIQGILHFFAQNFEKIRENSLHNIDFGHRRPFTPFFAQDFNKSVGKKRQKCLLMPKM